MNIKNVNFYAFFKPALDLNTAQEVLLNPMVELEIKGTILIAEEGINCSLAGPTEQMDEYLAFVLKTVGLNDAPLKVSFSEEIPFKRSRVKVKSHIVPPPGKTPVNPTSDAAPYISPEDFHKWIADNKKMLILDTRNDYEYQKGAFKDSIHLGTKHFADFESDLEKAPKDWQEMPIVTFCTGGIRCEKAAPLMIKKGFKKVYQLEGGILNYFKEVGRGYFQGECFVFDEREGV